MKHFSQHTTGLSPVLKKNPPLAKQTNKNRLEVKQEILWILCKRKKQGQSNKQHQKQQLIFTSYSSGADKSYALAATNKDGSYKDASTATHSTGTSGGTVAAAGHNSQ
jgi:hypothetical protein